MQIKVTKDGDAIVEVVDPTDGAVTHSVAICDGEQIIVTATSAHSPADIEFGEVEAIPSDEPDTETEAENERKVAEQPTPPEVADGASHGKAPASEQAQGDAA
jgi:hypothetical protein